MAYVGTPRYWNSDQYTLASILQGESSTQEGQIAVADVIENRAGADFSGYGSDALQQALATNQFQGQSTPTAQSLAIAAQMESGTLPQEVPGALYYANPNVAGDASWAANLNSGNSVDIGGNYFTDNQQGIPYTTTGASASGTSGYGGAGTPGQYTPGSVGTPDSSIGAADSIDPSNLTNISTGADSSLNPSSVPVAITTAQKAADVTETGVFSSIVNAVNTIATTYFKDIEDIFVRLGVVALGLLFVTGGVALIVLHDVFGKEETA